MQICIYFLNTIEDSAWAIVLIDQNERVLLNLLSGIKWLIWLLAGFTFS